MANMYFKKYEWKKDEAKPVDSESVKKLVEELKKLGIEIDEFKKPNKKSPQPTLPKIWTLPPKSSPFPRLPDIDDDWEAKQAEQELIHFMQECRERTADMKDSEKCERCKLRFRCFTEIKVEKKKKTKTTKSPLRVRPMVFKERNQVILDDLDDTKAWERKVNGIFDNYTKSNS